MLGRELTLFVWCLQASCLDVLAELLDSEEFSPTGAHPRGTCLLPSTSSLQPRDFASVCQFFKKMFPVCTANVIKKERGTGF